MSAAGLRVEDVARTYLTFARAFDYPRAEFWEGAEVEFVADNIVSHLSQEAREVEYVNAFELGGVLLYEGLHRRDEGREGILEDLLRFYHFFDLRLSADRRDYPDHLVTELEFMGYLASREAAALGHGEDPSPYRKAQWDFLARHLSVWVPLLEERIAKCFPPSDYRQLASLLAAFIERERKRLDSSLEGERP